MLIRSADYVISAPSLDNCPPPKLPEFAFIGRSNVGKSSLINLLTGRRKLALISGKPGKTKYLNYFLINEAWYLVDLPGYGFALASDADRKDWQRRLETYLLKRPSLLNTFLLVDVNVPPQDKDLAFARWMGGHNLPFSVVFTKADKSTRAGLAESVAAFEEAMRQDWEELPPRFIASSFRKTGRDELLGYIGSMLPLFSTSK